MIEDGVTIGYSCGEEEPVDLTCASDADCTSILYDKCALYYNGDELVPDTQPTCISESSCDTQIQVDEFTFDTYCDNG